VVGGHTHRQFDRQLNRHRFINPGSVGSPYEGRPGAFWALLGPDVSLRCSTYDIPSAAARMAASGFPGIGEQLSDTLTEPAEPDEVAEVFEALATGGS
jgi:hypothetical protein